MWGPDC